MTPGRRPLLGAVAWLALSGCAGASLRTPQPGEALAPGEVLVVGSIAAVPPFEPRGPIPSGVVLLGSARTAQAWFSTDLSEAWDALARRSPLEHAETALVPTQGTFFFVVPRASRLYLRGLVLYTDAGAEMPEVPLRLDVRPGDRVVYVGSIKLVRTGDRRILVRDDLRGARRAAAEAGLAALAAAPWTARLASAP